MRVWTRWNNARGRLIAVILGKGYLSKKGVEGSFLAKVPSAPLSSYSPPVGKLLSGASGSSAAQMSAHIHLS
jgi:hypothetical protein